MSGSEEFRSTVRSGTRVGCPSVVIHAEHSSTASAVRVGFVVSKAVGNAVVRNRVKRRLRHLARGRLPDTPAGARLVVRALPAAAATPGVLPADFDRAWTRVLARLSR